MRYLVEVLIEVNEQNETDAKAVINEVIGSQLNNGLVKDYKIGTIWKTIEQRKDNNEVGVECTHNFVKIASHTAHIKSSQYVCLLCGLIKYED